MRVGAFILVIWLVIGAFAAYQRNYFASESVNCAQLGTVLVTIVAGPLNYFGVNPKLDCAVPQPSK
jgi:riboflavin transporter FmnP